MRRTRHYSSSSKVEGFLNGAKAMTQMAISSGDTVPHIRCGELKFSVAGVPVALVVYWSDDWDDYFLPFMDT